MTDNRIVIYGAGNIGRGIVSRIFLEAGYHLLFYNRTTDRLRQLWEAGGYCLHIQGQDCNHSKQVTAGADFDIIESRQNLIARLGEVPLAACCLYPSAFPDVAEVLAEAAVSRRLANAAPLALLLFSNEAGGAAQLQELYRKALNKRNRTEAWKFLKIIPGIVYSVGFRSDTGNPFDITISPGGYLEAESIPGESILQAVPAPEVLRELPGIVGIRIIPSADSHLYRKLYLGNMFHTYAALLGNKKGYMTMEQCYADPKLKAKVREAFYESEAAVLRTYQFDPDEHNTWRKMMLGKMDIPSRDSIERVLTDLPRKLRRRDRLIGPLLLCISCNLECERLTEAAVMALEIYLGTDLRNEKTQYQKIAAACQLDPDEEPDHLVLEKIMSYWEAAKK